MNVKRFVDHYFVKLPIRVVIVSVKCFLSTALIVSLLFLVLWLSGEYVKLERVLNLGYNSPFVRIPKDVFFALMTWSFFRGLFRLYKRKRKKKKSEFRKVMSEIYADAE